jgi:hypothetical protein
MADYGATLKTGMDEPHRLFQMKVCILEVISVDFKDVNGLVINQHEKPPELTFQILRRFNRQGGTVLCIGGGCGGGAIGMIGMIPGAQTNLIILEPDKRQFKHLVQRVQRLTTPATGNIDITWLAGRVDFDIDQDLTYQATTCIGCGLVIAAGDSVDICSGCQQKVHVESPNPDKPCHLPKAVGSSLIFCGEHCRGEYASNHANC